MSPGYKRYKEKLDETYRKYADKDVMVWLKENGEKFRITFSALSQMVNSWIRVLDSCSVAAGDRVAIIAPLMPNTVAAGLTLGYANVTAVLLDYTLPPEEVNRLLEFSDVQGIFTTEALFPQIRNKNVPIFNLDRSGQDLVQFTLPAVPDRKEPVAARDREVLSIIYSSGTTSSMKGVMMTYDAALGSCEKLAYSYGLKAGIRYFMVLPYHHISGYISAATFLFSGASLCMMENLTPARLQKGLLEFSPHYFGMVPKVYDIMADKIMDAIRQKGRAIEKIFASGLRLSGFLRRKFGLKIGKALFRPVYSKALGKDITGLAILGTICRPETARLFLAFGLEWANLYGATETGAPLTTTGVFDRYPMNSVGKADQFDDINVVIHAPDAEGVGEVYVKTPLIMKGYFREPELTASAFDGSYFKTGDLGYIDRDHYLFLVGRSKDTIVLHNGKKVSAADIDAFYQNICPGVNIAACGVSEADGFDRIHLFVETDGQSRAAVDEARRRILEQSSASGALYQISGIHEIERLPLTSIGKVKRFLLKEAVGKPEPAQASEEAGPGGDEDVFDAICRLVLSATKGTGIVEPGSRLQEDLGMDSLNLFELCVELEERYALSIEPYLHESITVGEIAALIEQGAVKPGPEADAMGQYPLKKTEKDMKAYRRFMACSRKLWRMEVSGLENVRPGAKYIFCPNHESHLDGLWIIGSLDEETRRATCAFAADYLFEHKIFRRGLVVLGGIPVHREGNTALAIKCARMCLASGEHHLLLHPEGTRTRNGRLGGFKQGAAKLSIETGVSIIPVCIDGAYEIFPPHRKLPRLFDWKHFRRYPLKIRFGSPVSPSGETAEEITGDIRSQIVAMKQEGAI